MTKCRIALIAAIVVILALYASFMTNHLKVGSDSIQYLRLANSIISGQGYTIDGEFNHVWPPVTPGFTAVGLMISRGNLWGVKLVNAALTLFGIWIAYWLLASTHDKCLAKLTCILAAISFPVVYWAMDVSSEPHYLFFSIAGLAVLHLAVTSKKPAAWALAGGVLAGLAILSRAIGVALAAAVVVWAVWQLIRRQPVDWKKISLALVGTVLIAAGWFVYSSMKSGENSFSHYRSLSSQKDLYDQSASKGFSVTDQIKRVKDNLVGYSLIFSKTDSSIRMKKTKAQLVMSLISFSIMSLAAIGFLWHLFKRPGLTEMYLLCYGGILLLYIWYDIRYLVPIMPFVFYYMGFTIHQIVGWLAKLMNKAALVQPATTCILGALIAVNLLISGAGPQAKKLRTTKYLDPEANQYEAAQWIKANDPQAVVLCRNSGMMWFWTRQTCKGIPLISDPEAMWKHIKDQHVTLVLDAPDTFSNVTEKYLDPALAAHAAQTEKLQTFGEVTILRIKP